MICYDCNAEWEDEDCDECPVCESTNIEYSDIDEHKEDVN